LIRFRGCRFAQSPANGWEPFGFSVPATFRPPKNHTTARSGKQEEGKSIYGQFDALYFAGKQFAWNRKDRVNNLGYLRQLSRRCRRASKGTVSLPGCDATPEIGK
jgi:hypothetical protein